MTPISRRRFLAVASSMLAVRFSGWSCSTASAEPQWRDYRSQGPFDIRGTYSLESLVPLFQELTKLEVELQRTLGIPPASDRIEINLVESKQAHRKLLGNLYPPVPYRRALYVKRNKQGSVYAYQHSDLAIDLRHECTHALLHSNLPVVPLWLDEGLAEYFEMAEEKRAFGHPHFHKLKWDLRLGMVRTIESLEACHDLEEMGSVEYRFSWAWAHFMLHGPLAAHRTLVYYLADIRRGNPPGLLSQRLRKEIPKLDEQMILHFKHWRRS